MHAHTYEHSHAQSISGFMRWKNKVEEKKMLILMLKDVKGTVRRQGTHLAPGHEGHGFHLAMGSHQDVWPCHRPEAAGPSNNEGEATKL